MKTKAKHKLGYSERATLARARIAGACRGVHTAEFKQWRRRAQEVAGEHLSGVRVPQLQSKQSARHRGWIEAENEFRKEHPDRADELIGFTTRDAKPVSLAQELRWAYRHAAVYSVSEVDAPSPGAWLWLQEARANRSQFLGKVFALEQATHSGKLPREELDSDADDSDLTMEDFLASIHGNMAKTTQ